MFEVTHRLDKVASILQDRGLLGVASQIDVVANTIEKTAANRRMREYVDESMNKWFPEKVKSIKEHTPKVYDEIVDNLAAGFLELYSPGRNKALNKDTLFDYTDKNGEPISNLPEYLRNTLFFNRLKSVPSLGQPSEAMLRALSSNIAEGIIRYAEASPVAENHLKEENGRPIQKTFRYILDKIVPSKVTYFDSATKSNKTVAINPKQVSEELSAEIAKSSASVLIDLLSGQTKKKPSKDYTDRLKNITDSMNNVWASKAVQDYMGSLLDKVWRGPIDIQFDLSKLSDVLSVKQTDDLIGRMHTLKTSPMYKDEERTMGAQSRLPKFVSPTTPWNKGQELIFVKGPDGKLTLKEGFHRFMAMLLAIQSTHQTKFTVSAYIEEPITKEDPSKKGLISGFMDLFKNKVFPQNS